MSLKLWVVGEDDPDPEKWSIWSEYRLVVAATAEDAVKLAGREGWRSPVTEVDMSKPQLLVAMSEPQWGDDI